MPLVSHALFLVAQGGGWSNKAIGVVEDAVAFLKTTVYGSYEHRQEQEEEDEATDIMLQPQGSCRLSAELAGEEQEEFKWEGLGRFPEVPKSRSPEVT